MGGKYIISLMEESVFLKKTYPTTEYHVSNIFQVIKLLITKRKKINYITINFF